MSEEPSEPLAGVDPASVDPDDVDPDEVRAALESDVNLVRGRGAQVCGAIAATDPESARQFADALCDRLDDESLAVARHAGTALVVLSEECPGAVEDLENAVTLAENDLGGIRLLGAKVLANVVVDYPERCRPHADRLLAAVAETEGTYSQSDLEEHAEVAADTEAAQTVKRHNLEEAKQRILARNATANVVVAVAEDDPETAVALAADAAPLLDDPDPNVVGAALDVYRAAGEHDPEAVSDAVDDILACLDRDEEMVRARAIRTLGFAEADAALDRLRDVAENDADEDVRALAAETVDFLAEQ